MAQLAVIHKASEGWAPMSQYDSTKWTLGDLIKRRTDISTNGSGTPYVGPCAVGLARPFEQSAATSGIFPWVTRWSNKNFRYTGGTVTVSGTTVTGIGTTWMSSGIAINVNIGFGSSDERQITTWYNIDSIQSNTGLTLSSVATTYSGATAYVIENFQQIDWVFLADNLSAALTRKIQLYEYNRLNSTFSWKGYETITPQAAGTHTMKSLRMTYDLYTTGTVSVTNQYVSGVGTTWTTDRMCVGSRIGFGTNDPAQIKTWYIISTITGDTSLTLTIPSTISYSAGTSYVIEDLRGVLLTTNTTNGGLFIAKGLNHDDFTTGGTTVPFASSTDNIKATYWLKDASTINNVTGCGLALEPRTDWITQMVYVLDSATVKIYKYNIRKALTLSSGADLTAFQYVTGNQAVSGTLSATNNGRFAIARHGPCANIPAIYFVTTTRIYCTPTSAIVNGSTTFLQYTMMEIPPGSVNTFAATGGLACIEYSDPIDKFIVTSTGAAGVRSYVTQFRTDGAQMDHIFLIDDKQINQSLADGGITPHPVILVLTQTPWSEGGMLYMTTLGNAANTNFLYAVPTSVDWTYASLTNQRAITPVFNTPNAINYIGQFTWRDSILGSDLLGKRTDAFRMYYRTVGISDNSGSWILIAEPPDFSGIAGSNQIQFMYEFRAITDYCIPARIFGTGIIYQDSSSDVHFRFSGGFSSATNKQFVFRFVTAFGTSYGNVTPTLYIRLYDDVTGALLVQDNSATPTYGTWAKGTIDGAPSGMYTTTDKTNDTTYIGYTPTSLGSNIKVRAVLTLS
jgi:hypothetical protein